MSVQINLYSGVDCILPFLVQQGGLVTSPPTNITGWTLGFQVRQKNIPTLPTILDLSVTVTDGPNGLAQLGLTHVETLLIPTKNGYWWELWRLDTGSLTVVQNGIFMVLPEMRYNPAA